VGASPQKIVARGTLLDQLRRLAEPTDFEVMPEGDAFGRGGVTPSRSSRTVGRAVRAAQPVATQPTGSWFGWPTKITPQVGAIWEYIQGAWYQTCSGTVVSRGLVLTAGHCVSGTDGSYSGKLAFVPGQTWNSASSTDPGDIKAPWGAWAARDWWAPDSYRFGRGGPDWGLIEITPIDGKFIGDVVGSFPIKTNVKYNLNANVWSMGYPGSGKWSRTEGYVGRGQYGCNSRWTGRWDQERYEQTGTDVVLALDCPMNRGASGGPWIVSTTSGWVISGVNNWCQDDNTADDEDTYCTPVSSRLQSLLIDGRFGPFWDSVVKLLHY